MSYEEHLFFGLSMRQFVSAALAVGSAVGAYFLLRDRLGTELTSWVCMACAAPCALLGFIRIQGQTFEKFVHTWVESEIMFPSVMVCRCENAYYEAVQRRREGQIPEIKAPEAQKGKGGKVKKQKPPTQNVRKQDGFDLYQSPNIYKFRRRGKGI